MKNVWTRTVRVIPVFFKVNPADVIKQKEDFGVKIYGQGRRKRPRMSQWEEALESVPTTMGLVLPENGSHDDLLLKIVKAIKELEAIIIAEIESGDISTMTCSDRDSSYVTIEQSRASLPPYGIKQCLNQLEEKFDFEANETHSNHWNCWDAWDW